MNILFQLQLQSYDCTMGYISFTNSQSGLQDEDHDQVHLILDHL